MTYLYNVVDGIFVGQGIGSAALDAVNIAVPFITTVVAVAAMFPMGGAAIVAIRMGRGIVLEALMIFCLPLIFASAGRLTSPDSIECNYFIFITKQRFYLPLDCSRFKNSTAPAHDTAWRSHQFTQFFKILFFISR